MPWLNSPPPSLSESLVRPDGDADEDVPRDGDGDQEEEEAAQDGGAGGVHHSLLVVVVVVVADVADAAAIAAADDVQAATAARWGRGLQDAGPLFFVLVLIRGGGEAQHCRRKRTICTFKKGDKSRN